jgi:hypothetical protein
LLVVQFTKAKTKKKENKPGKKKRENLLIAKPSTPKQSEANSKKKNRRGQMGIIV